MKKHPIYAGVIVTRPLVRSLVTPGQVGEAEARPGSRRELAGKSSGYRGADQEIASWGKGMQTFNI